MILKATIRDFEGNHSRFEESSDLVESPEFPNTKDGHGVEPPSVCSHIVQKTAFAAGTPME